MAPQVESDPDSGTLDCGNLVVGLVDGALLALWAHDSDMPVLMPQCLEAVLSLQSRMLGVLSDEMCYSLHQL